jgi:hypothetical protein
VVGGEGGVNLFLIALYPLKGPALTFGGHGVINRYVVALLRSSTGGGTNMSQNE